MRYRVRDVSRAVTRVAIREARLSEIKRELLNSEKLSEHFQSNPHDAAVLHDEHLRPKAIQTTNGFAQTTWYLQHYVEEGEEQDFEFRETKKENQDQTKA